MTSPLPRSVSRCSALAVAFGLAWVAMAAPLRGQAVPAAPDTVRILFIGNSYTQYNNLPQILQSMASASSRTRRIEVGTAFEDGAPLRTHWTARTRDLIRTGNWDYVVLQEQSLTPLQAVQDFIASGERFGREIRAAGAQPVLFVTWARQGRPTAQDSLDRAYKRLSDQIRGTLVPVGPAWRELQRLDPTARLYAADGSHPSPLGSFVAAATFYRTLSGGLPAPSYRVPPGLTTPALTLVHRAVETAVGRSPRR